MTSAELPAAAKPVVYIIHDNPEWIPPFAEAFEAEGVEFVEWLLTERVLDLDQSPPKGIFWSRLSASSHTRTDPHVKEHGRAVLAWLEAAGRTVINGSGVYELEVSKIRQHSQLSARGFDVPKTVAVFGHQGLVPAARTFTPPFITKHNQGGKGLGVQRFDSYEEFQGATAEFAPGGGNEPIDGITLLQEYVQPAEPFITRAEFIGGTLHYAVKVDISGGSFELCPAEACEVPSENEAVVAPPQFQRRHEITGETPLIAKLTRLLDDLNITIAGVEFIETADGRQVVYDINTNTNYNPDVESAEQEAGRLPAARRIVGFLADQLKAVSPELVSAH